MNNKTTVRGRPIDKDLQLEKRNKLMDAAYDLLQQNSYRSITIREIAAGAEMKSAMISYYFGGKESLFIALLERQAEQQFERFQQILTDENPIRTFITLANRYFAGNMAITRLIADEVLFQNSALSERFIELFPKRMAMMLPRLIKAQQTQGLASSNVNPKWAAFSLITLILMPYIGATVRQRGWDISDCELNSDAWVEHIYRLFTKGFSEDAANEI